MKKHFAHKRRKRFGINYRTRRTGGADIADGAAADAAANAAIAAAVVRGAVYAAVILKTIDIDHPL